MKIISLLLAALLAGSMAQARDIISFTCKGEYAGNSLSAEDNWEITLESEKYYSYLKANEAHMNGITMTIKMKDRDYVAVGRRLGITNFKNYRPRKYKNYYRFDMSQLVNVENFGDFHPDFCQINTHLPKDLVESGVDKVVMPVLFHCEHHGGLAKLSCDVKTRR